MPRVKMVLELDFEVIQKTKAMILNLAMSLSEGEREPLSVVMNILDSIQDQSLDHPDNKFTHKQVYGS
jgi:intracellular sulfur oxidation DsrE/DsrF family protein